MPSLSLGKRRIHRLAPLALIAVVAAVAPTASSMASASTASASTAGASTAGASAVRQEAASPFSCFADPLRITAPGQPGPNLNKPCRDDQVGGAQSAGSVGPVQVTATGTAGVTSVTAGTANALTATESSVTMTTVGGQATAVAKSAHLVVGKTVIDLGGMTTKSMISCTYSAKGSSYSFSSTSSVKSVKINGKPLSIGAGAQSIKLPAGTLWLNHTSKTATGITQHAAMLHTSSADVALGEAAVGLSNAAHNPCHR